MYPSAPRSIPYPQRTGQAYAGCPRPPPERRPGRAGPRSDRRAGPMRRAFGDRARMVSVDSGGHEVYLAHGNACGDRLVTDFLVTGHRPARDAFCPAETG
ncbi:alpha/beta hydrolase [Actinoallomurus bryophytorum]